MEKSAVTIVKSVGGRQPLLIDGPQKTKGAEDMIEGEKDGVDDDDDDDQAERVYGPPSIEIVRPSSTPAPVGEEEDVGAATTTAATFVLVLGHHQVPERQRSKFSPHHGVAGDPHAEQREKDLDRIVQQSESSVYPAIKDVNGTPWLMLEGSREGEESNGKTIVPGRHGSVAPAGRRCVGWWRSGRLSRALNLLPIIAAFVQCLS